METLGKTVEKIQKLDKNVKWIFMIDDFRAAHASIQKGDLSIIKWLSTLKGRKEFAIFKINDPLPLFSLIKKTMFI